MQVLQDLFYCSCDSLLTLGYGMCMSDHNDKSVQVTSHYKTCIDLLDVFYLRRTRIYRQLSTVVADKQEAPHDTQ